MPYQKGTITLAAARRIFPHFAIKEQILSGQPTGIYSATFTDRAGVNQQVVEKGLTNLCVELVELLAEGYYVPPVSSGISETPDQ
jgi:hypothetical protein